MRKLYVLMLAFIPVAVVASPQDMQTVQSSTAFIEGLPPPPKGFPPPPQDMIFNVIGQRFAQADTNHDGKLTLSEANVGMKLIVPYFNQIDISHKGYITLDQIEAFGRSEASPQSYKPDREGATF